jgi:hypothetical protein
MKSNSNIENIDNTDESEFNGLIKGLKVRQAQNQLARKSSIEVV